MPSLLILSAISVFSYTDICPYCLNGVLGCSFLNCHMFFVLVMFFFPGESYRLLAVHMMHLVPLYLSECKIVNISICNLVSCNCGWNSADKIWHNDWWH